MSQAAAKRMDELIEEIEYHRQKYYGEDNPVISDREYDLLEKELLELEAAHPTLVRAHSSSFRVGSGVVDSHPSMAHATPMLSLGNAYNQEDLAAYLTRTSVDIGASPVYAAELKIDGLSLSVVYEHGVMARAVTRGDGKVGEEVTANAKTIKELPLRVPAWEDYPEMEVRGEVYMRKGVFDKLNVQRLEEDKPQFANPRNAAAGSFRQLDSGETARRSLSMFVFQIVGSWAEEIPSHLGRLKAAGALGFPINPLTREIKGKADLFQLIDEWAESRGRLDYETDGVVLKVDDPSLYERIGYTSKFPKWATAYKFAAEQATTQIRNIEIQVGRTGVLTPVANFEPTPLAGTTVSRATLHNFDEISKKDIREGDWVFIEKGGDIIPKVVKVILEKRTGNEKAITQPDSCPRCGGDTFREEDQVAVRCVNLACPAQLERRITHFSARGAMDIQGLGKERVQQMVAEGLIPDLPSIYRLTSEQLWKLDRVGEKWISNLLSEIEKSKSRPFSKLLFAVGIPMIGAKVAEVLVENFGSYDRLASAGEGEIAAIHGMGEKVAWSVFSHLRLESFKQAFQDFKELGLSLEEIQTSSDEPKPLTGKTIVVTGSFQSGSRTELTALLKGLGASVTGSVTGKTDLLLAGEKAGSKLAKAEALGVEIVNEEWVEQWQSPRI